MDPLYIGRPLGGASAIYSQPTVLLKATHQGTLTPAAELFLLEVPATKGLAEKLIGEIDT